jgi:galactokinase
MNAPNPPIRLLVMFQERFPDQALHWLVKVPGWEMWAAAASCGGYDLTLAAPDLDGQTTFNLRSAKSKRTVFNRPLPRWARYPAGVLVVLGEMGLEISGLNIALVGEEPSGPRYDYALGVAFLGLAYDIHGRESTRENLIEVVERVRRDYMGE